MVLAATVATVATVVWTLAPCRAMTMRPAATVLVRTLAVRAEQGLSAAIALVMRHALSHRL